MVERNGSKPRDVPTGEVAPKATRRKVVNGATKSEAKKAAEALWQEITTPRVEVPHDQIILVTDALEAHRRRPGTSPWTTNWEARCAARLVEGLGEETRICDITAAAVERYKRTRGSMVAPRTCNMELQVLKACLNWLVEMGYVSTVPCRIKKLPEARRRFKALTAEQANALLKECQGELYDVLACLLTLGLRRSELYNMKWGDVNFADKVLLVRSKKRGVSATIIENRIPIGSVAMEVLERRHKSRHLRPTDLVFGRDKSMRRRGKGECDGIEYTYDAKLSTKLKDAAKRAGIPDHEKIRPYDLRHTFATLALRSGANVRDVAALLRHRSPQLTLEVYAHESENLMRQAVDGLGIEENGQRNGQRPKQKRKKKTVNKEVATT